MAVSALSRNQLTAADPVGDTDCHVPSGPGCGCILSVRAAPALRRAFDDRSACRADRFFAFHGQEPTSQLATAGKAAGKAHATASPIHTECGAYVAGMLQALVSFQSATV